MSIQISVDIVTRLGATAKKFCFVNTQFLRPAHLGSGKGSAASTVHSKQRGFTQEEVKVGAVV